MLDSVQLDLLTYRARGPYLNESDQWRLSRQRQIVFDCLKDGKERSLQQISKETGEREASISARWRELKDMARRGAPWTCEKRNLGRGLWMYRVLA